MSTADFTVFLLATSVLVQSVLVFMLSNRLDEIEDRLRQNVAAMLVLQKSKKE